MPNPKLKVVDVGIDELIPYAGNAKQHPDWQVDQIVQSIEEFGFNDPIGIWHDEDGKAVIVEGHGRLLAAKELGLSKVPVVYLDHMDDEARRAYTIVHNQTTMNSGFDKSVLNAELASLKSFSMEDYGLEPMTMEQLAEQHEANVEATIDKCVNILNTGIALYDGAGPYDIPNILPTYELPEIDNWIGFNYVLSDDSEDKTRTGVHFFIDDYQFERVWKRPEFYAEKLAEYGCIIAPDFSPMGGLPMATQIWNHYRKHWVARYLQENGITVVPCIRSSTDEFSLSWYLDGVPTNSVVCISSMWATFDESESEVTAEREYKTMVEKLEPSLVLVYGKEYPYMEGSNTQFIEFFWESMVRRREAKHG